MDSDNLIRCPNCGASHYQYHYSVTTTMYFPPIYKDGINTNPDGNLTTNYCTCCECDHDFYYQVQYGEVIEVMDQGKREPIPTISILDGSNTLTLDPDYSLAKPQHTESTEIEFKMSPQLMETLEKLSKSIEQLQVDVEEIKKAL